MISMSLSHYLITKFITWCLCFSRSEVSGTFTFSQSDLRSPHHEVERRLRRNCSVIRHTGKQGFSLVRENLHLQRTPSPCDYFPQSTFLFGRNQAIREPTTFSNGFSCSSHFRDALGSIWAHKFVCRHCFSRVLAASKCRAAAIQRS